MKKIACAILLIMAIILVGCSSKQVSIKRITNSTNPVNAVTPADPSTNSNSKNTNPNKATADVNGYKKLNLTSITTKVVGNNAIDFYSSAQISFIYIVLKDFDNDKVIATQEISSPNRSNAENILNFSNGTLGSVKLEENKSLLHAKVSFYGEYDREEYFLNQTLVAPLINLSDNKVRANFHLIINDNVKIKVMCDFDIEFVETL